MQPCATFVFVRKERIETQRMENFRCIHFDCRYLYVSGFSSLLLSHPFVPATLDLNYLASLSKRNNFWSCLFEFHYFLFSISLGLLYSTYPFCHFDFFGLFFFLFLFLCLFFLLFCLFHIHFLPSFQAH